jgi:hypothetical protein
MTVFYDPNRDAAWSPCDVVPLAAVRFFLIEAVVLDGLRTRA